MPTTSGIKQAKGQTTHAATVASVSAIAAVSTHSVAAVAAHSVAAVSTVLSEK